MGTIADKLDYLLETKNSIRSAIEEQGVTVSDTDTFRSYAELIRSIETSSDDIGTGGSGSGDSGTGGSGSDTDTGTETTGSLTSVSATPNGAMITLKPGYNLCEGLTNFIDGVKYYEYDYTNNGYFVTRDTVSSSSKSYYTKEETEYKGYNKVQISGDEYLISENVKKGVTIYGVEGTFQGEKEIPSPYDTYIEKAKTMYTGTYENIFVSDNGSYTNVVFMKENFSIVDFDTETSSYTYIGGVSVGGGAEWTVNDYSSTTSPSGSFAKNIKYSDTYIKYDDITLFPVGIQAVTDLQDSKLFMLASLSFGSASSMSLFESDDSYFSLTQVEVEEEETE